MEITDRLQQPRGECVRGVEHGRYADRKDNEIAYLREEMQRINLRCIEAEDKARSLEVSYKKAQEEIGRLEIQISKDDQVKISLRKKLQQACQESQELKAKMKLGSQDLSLVDD